MDLRRMAGHVETLQLERVKVVAAEGRDQHPAKLVIVGGHFQLFGGAANGEVVDKNLPLLHGALGHAAELPELR